MVQLRKSDDSNSGWSDRISFSSSSDNFLGLLLPNLRKDKIIVQGSSRGYTKSELKAYEMDTKIALIPAANVIEMQARKVDTDDLDAVARHLNL